MSFFSSLLRVLPVSIVGLALMAACGGSGDSTADDDAGSEPLIVEHAYGSTEITEVPETVVTIDVQWTDVMLALDAEVIGYTADPHHDSEPYPWQEFAGDIEALDATDGLPIEQIAALDPDLIVGTFSIADQATYDLLSGIAPTVANLAGDGVTPWQDLVALGGDILDKADEAAALTASVEDEVAAVAEELPGLAGKSFELAQYVVGDSMYVVADENDGSSIFFSQLGMEMFEPVKEEGVQQGAARINVSVERGDLLRADLVAFLVNGGDASDLDDIPGFDRLPGTVAVLDYATIVGLNTPSPLSIPYSLEQVRPYLDDVA